MAQPKQTPGTFDPKTGRPINKPGACTICGAYPPIGGGSRCTPPKNGH